MGIVLQFRTKQGSSAVLPLSQSSKIDQRGDGPALDSGSLSAFYDRCAKKRNARLRLRGMSLSSQPVHPLRPRATDRTRVPVQPTETP